MSKARLVITAVLVEGRSQSQVARDYGVSQGWISRLIKRYTLEGDTAFEPRSRRPHTSPRRLPQTTIDLIIELRQRLAGKGLDAGPHTIAWHLHHHHRLRVSPASISRHLHAAGLVEPAPHKRPKTSYIRFAAQQPNERWQSDFTHWRLANGTTVEILCWLDDCSRLALSVTAHRRITGAIVVNEFTKIIAQHGIPYSTLTDNAMVYTTRFAGGKGGRNGFEAQLHRHGITQINSTPNHPTTCGKVERFHQTLKKFLTKQPAATSLTELQALLDRFAHHYNQHRPHRALARHTPAEVFDTKLKARPATTNTHTHFRVRHDKVDQHGSITIRYQSRLHHIGMGARNRGREVVMLIADRDIRVITPDGELLRHLELDPTRDYQPQTQGWISTMT